MNFFAGVGMAVCFAFGACLVVAVIEAVVAAVHDIEVDKLKRTIALKDEEIASLKERAAREIEDDVDNTAKEPTV